MDIRTERVKEIFLGALEIGSEEGRRAFLDRACGEDAALRGEVEGLLAHHPQVGSFLDSGAPGLPITIGIGIDYAVNLAVRDRQEGSRGPAHLMTTTGSAVLNTSKCALRRIASRIRTIASGAM